jgi:type III restriction enzyme
MASTASSKRRVAQPIGFSFAPAATAYLISALSYKDRVRRSFNPDFLIQINLQNYLTNKALEPSPKAVQRLRALQDQGIEELIFVVEIKSDDDDSEATRAKGTYGTDHFNALNQRLREINPIDLLEDFRDSVNQQNIFYTLRPSDYPGWFSRFRSGLFCFDLETVRETNMVDK